MWTWSCQYTDIFQVGARNTQNYSLLKALGKQRKPVFLKRGISGTIQELLMSAEYILSGGNMQVMLCERGIRTYETATRNTFDINAIPVLKELTHLPDRRRPGARHGHVATGRSHRQGGRCRRRRRADDRGPSRPEPAPGAMAPRASRPTALPAADGRGARRGAGSRPHDLDAMHQRICT